MWPPPSVALSAILQALGLATLPLAVPTAPRRAGRVGAAGERSQGMDTTTGHWEMMGIVTEQPFPTSRTGSR